MKRQLSAYIFSLFILPASYASSIPQEWSCLAFDKKEQSYSGHALRIDDAMKNAKSSCQKNSLEAKTCRTAQSYCEERPISGQGRCIVTDDDGHAWDIDGEDSCKQAMSMCNRFLYLEGGAHGQCWIKYGGESGNLDVD